MTIFRRPTRPVFVGPIGIGGDNPVRVQSMISAPTTDTTSAVREIEALAKASCEIVRLTVPTKADSDNLKNIRRELKQKKIIVPLVADIHFTPSVALDCVDWVEKIRINPGNFDLNKFPALIEKCKVKKVALRIGVNHGSLSKRAMERFGDTPQGMVESAIEFLRVAIDNNFHDIVFSMKASNVGVMIDAYRLLAQTLDKQGWNYPFHLGVTEAGDGEAARIKSAVGIGTLLMEGIGDTIRVSLTEDSVNEIPVAYAILQACRLRITQTEYIMCPTCGRTQYDLKKVAQEIKARTAHCVGLKIAIMGCIVNGPGEMADADFGYVGMGHGKVALYKGKECVEKNIPEENAVEKFLELIQKP